MMEFCTPQPSRRKHNPVDSICKKIQSIQWRGQREPNSPFQIPKLSTPSYDTPQCDLRSNLEALLKRGALYSERIDQEKDRTMGMPSSAASMATSPVTMATPATPNHRAAPSANVTYTISSTMGERRGADGSDMKHVKMWPRYCSMPTGNTPESPYFTFTQGSVQTDGEKPCSPHTRSPPTPRPFHTMTSYKLNFTNADTTSTMDTTESEVPYPALLVQRLSLGDSGMSTSDGKKGTMTEISLICEENLLDTIFYACDTQRRGKVYVSHIVDYLRHTTSRSSEDSGLEELCNMLDPEHKDVSIDLDTYHAVMREWIEDCRNTGEETTAEATQDSAKMRDSISARRSMLLNMTCGSLEAFGGDVSRVEFETSELVHCVTDLQMNNQKLQEEVKKLKQVVESMEDSEQKLVEENKELRNLVKMNQQLVQKEKMLKDEVEEMKATLSKTDEGRARASAHGKHMEKENQSLITQIASLQEENFKVTMEMDKLTRRISDLCDINADLQVQIHSFDGVLSEKEVELHEKMRQINELKATVEEYSSITELLRADKSKLENQIQMLHPALVRGLSLSVAYRLNQSITGSLQSELALAQSPLEPLSGPDPLSTTSLDETLDKEVLLMMQGPSPEHMSQEYKSALCRLKRNITEESGLVLGSVRQLLDDRTNSGFNTDESLQSLGSALDSRRSDWVQSLDLLAQYTDSLEKELIKMAGNMRRSRTEILHLSVRVQEQENQRRQLCEEIDLLRGSEESSRQTPVPDSEDLVWDEEFAVDYMKNEEITNYCSVNIGSAEGAPSEETRKGDEEGNVESDKEADKWTDSDVKEKSTLYINVYMETQSRDETSEAPDVCSDPSSAVGSLSEKEEEALPASAHSQAVGHSEANSDPAHSPDSGSSQSPDPGPSHSPGPVHSPDPNPALSPDTGPAHSHDHSAEERLPQTACDSPQNDSAAPSCGVRPQADAQTEDSTPNHNSSLTTEEQPDVGSPEQRGEEEDSEMNRKSLGQDKSDRPDDSSGPLPVLVEEEETEAAMATASVPAHHSSSSHPSAATGASLNSVSPKASPQKQDPSTGSETLDQRGTRAENDTMYQNSNGNDSHKEDKNGMTPTDKEVETEFQRLALGFKCDMFTLEKRLRLEERSRDLAEENMKREVSSCQGLLQALMPLCEEDSQSMEIILRLQKNLEILTQSMSRVSSRSEMLGAIHQENRIGKAVEVMIQHVENLRRMYTKEHAELLELRETLMQNERSFGSQTKKDDFQGKKTQGRRVSLPPINPISMRKPLDLPDMESERLTRRAPWSPDELFVMLPSPSSSPTSSDPALSQSLSRGLGSSKASAAAVARSNRTVWLWLAMFVLLAGLLALLAGLVMQPAVDAAPVGTGDSWMTIQQLLWPYTGLRHQAPPPV